MKVFLWWWYREGWAEVAKSLNKRAVNVAQVFSVNQLLSTLFAPWRRIITYPGASLQDKFRAWTDNIFSRTIGFVIRVFVLIVAFLMTVVISLLTIIELILWPLLPIGIIGGLIAGLIW
ncbi:MAG TPA: hypothetical protein VFN31_02655 [Candidatus Saccharimonadales bacterium]|nr:hypothetical protein [Candidatus Saccharimonadales bacterium]